MVAASGCGEARSAAPHSEVRDSAGITIVENARPDPDGPAPWILQPEPEVVIGVLSGEEAYQLFQVVSALRFDDGRIAVANRGSQEVRFFGPDGTHLSSFGGEGEGPGEFQGISGVVRLPGDSLGVWDVNARRMTVLTPDGELGRTVRLEEREDVRFPFVAGVLSDGTLLAYASAVYSTSDDLESGLSRRSRRYYRFGRDGAVLDSLLTLPGSESTVVTGDNFIMIRTAPFSRSPHVHVSPGGFVAGASDRYELGSYDATGDLSTIIRTDHPVLPVDQSLQDAYWEAELAEAEDAEDRAEIRERRESTDFPPSAPAFADLEVDALGNVWVKDYELPGTPEGPDSWLVYDPDGRILGGMELPDGFTVYEIGEDYVLGKVTDELGVEQVRLYGLERER